MRFVVTMYLTVEAASEDEAREIVDTIELKSKYEESILNVMDTERLIQNSVIKIVNSPLTCPHAGGEMLAEGVLNNLQRWKKYLSSHLRGLHLLQRNVGQPDLERR